MEWKINIPCYCRTITIEVLHLFTHNRQQAHSNEWSEYRCASTRAKRREFSFHYFQFQVILPVTWHFWYIVHFPMAFLINKITFKQWIILSLAVCLDDGRCKHFTEIRWMNLWQFIISCIEQKKNAWKCKPPNALVMYTWFEIKCSGALNSEHFAN